MENKCILCGIELESEEFCETCLEVLKQKYPDKKCLETILQWHKNQNKKLNEDG